MNKKLIEYDKKYGEISKDNVERFLELLNDKNIKTKDIKAIKDKIEAIKSITCSRLDFILYMEPEASPRPRLGKFGSFYVKGARNNNDFFSELTELLEGKFEKIVTANRMIMDMYLPIPEGMNRTDALLAELKLIRPLSRPDWDNFGKTYSDMIQKHLLLEDCLVVDGEVRKFYSLKPRIEFSIIYQDKFDSKYNKKKVESWKVYDESYPSKDSV